MRLATLVFLWSAIASAEESQCPSADAVSAELIKANAQPMTAHDVQLIDLGAQFEIAIDGAMRRFDDVGRDCKERARTAAVLIAMAVTPSAVVPPPSSTRD